VNKYPGDQDMLNKFRELLQRCMMLEKAATSSLRLKQGRIDRSFGSVHNLLSA
jgi:hypothetical protein